MGNLCCSFMQQQVDSRFEGHILRAKVRSSCCLCYYTAHVKFIDNVKSPLLHRWSYSPLVIYLPLLLSSPCFQSLYFPVISLSFVSSLLVSFLGFLLSPHLFSPLIFIFLFHHPSLFPLFCPFFLNSSFISPPFGISFFPPLSSSLKCSEERHNGASPSSGLQTQHTQFSLCPSSVVVRQRELRMNNTINNSRSVLAEAGKLINVVTLMSCSFIVQV